MSYNQCDRVIGENLEEGHSILSMPTTDDFLSLHPHHQFYSSSPTTNNITVGTQNGDIDGEVLMNSTYEQSSTTLAVEDVHVNYEVQDDQEDDDYESLVRLINIHVEKEEEEKRPWPAADVSSWEWPRFSGTLESIIHQDACFVPLIIHVPDHGVLHDHVNEVEEEEEDDDQVVLLEDQEYFHITPQVLADMENTLVQSGCNTESMRMDDPLGEAEKITEKRQMQIGASSTTISSSNKRIKATILHNKSERERRHKLNEKMETLQKLVPNFNKTDKVSMLDQVIEYVKKLQSQNDQMTNMRTGMFDNNNMPTSVHPMMMMHYITTMEAMQQEQEQEQEQEQQQQHHHHQQQMSMIDQMGMGMSMNPAGLVMMPTGSDVHPNICDENKHICSN